jgi:hypothetical protein
MKQMIFGSLTNLNLQTVRFGVANRFQFALEVKTVIDKIAHAIL